MHDGVDDARNGRVAGPDLFCMSVIEWLAKESNSRPHRILTCILTSLTPLNVVSILWEFVKNHLPSSSRWWCLCDMAFYGLLLPLLCLSLSLFLALNIDTTDDDGVTSKRGKKNVCRCWLPSVQFNLRKHFNFMMKYFLSKRIIFDFLMVRHISWQESTNILLPRALSCNKKSHFYWILIIKKAQFCCSLMMTILWDLLSNVFHRNGLRCQRCDAIQPLK